MERVLKYDIYRLQRSAILYGVLGFAILIPLFLTMVMNNEINLGISIYGNVEEIKSVTDIIFIGTQYYKGLGYLVAVVISVFWGQEYLWNTIGKKVTMVKNRDAIYFSKVLLSCSVSAIIYCLFECTIFFFAKENLLNGENIYKLISGLIPYIALGAVFAMITTIVKNNVVALLTCFGYVLFTEPIFVFVQGIEAISPYSTIVVKYTIYGMVQRASTSTSLLELCFLIINTLVIVIISSIVGRFVFRRQEL